VQSKGRGKAELGGVHGDDAALIVAPISPGLRNWPVMPARLRERYRSYFVGDARFSSGSFFAAAGADETLALLKEIAVSAHNEA
jgi:hypothetical protein